MTRPLEQSLADIDVMAEAIERLQQVLYAKPYFEKRYEQALKRVVTDLGDTGRVLERMLYDDWEALVEVFRIQFVGAAIYSGGRDKL